MNLIRISIIVLCIIKEVVLNPTFIDHPEICKSFEWGHWGHCVQNSNSSEGVRKRQRDYMCTGGVSKSECQKKCRVVQYEEEEPCNVVNIDPVGVVHVDQCPNIEFCKTVNCTSPSDNICTKCEQQSSTKETSLYWPINGNRTCEATCSFNNQWCWPGTCSNSNRELDKLRPSCQCHTDFEKDKAGNAKCMLRKKPDLVTCRLGTENTQGEIKNSTTNGNCFNEGSVYINFDISAISFTFEMQFSVHIIRENPTYIAESHFGIVQSEIRVNKIPVHGYEQTELYHYRLSSISDGCSHFFSEDSPQNVITCKNNYGVDIAPKDGEWICLQFKAYGGGFLIHKDFEQKNSAKQLYKQTEASNDVCLRYDSSSPTHCIENGCTIEPIQFRSKTTKTNVIHVSLIGWTDPQPSGGLPEQASGIKHFELALHKMSLCDTQTMRMEENHFSDSQILTKTSNHEVLVTLPTDNPSLFGISVTVVDNANNYRKARRFVYFDNSSRLEIDHAKIFKFDSATLDSNFTWQTNHGQICMSWTDRYYNTFNGISDNNVLKAIKTSSLYMGNYDQNSGLFSVNGTPNIHGILSFKYRYKLNNGIYTTSTSVPHFITQSLCTKFAISDGESYTYGITSVDLIENKLEEEHTIYIDASVPDIENIWLVKDGHRQLFVHNSTDLSRMNIEFDVLDKHSGIHSIHWAFGITRGGNELGQGAVGVHKINGSCGEIAHCYCPDIGGCEIYRHRINLNLLVFNNTHIGQHNRNYFFTIKAINIPKLVNIRTIDILSDDSPPHEGVVQEADMGNKDIDYTSFSETIVSWNGFFDHESGIKFYILGFSRNCLSLHTLLKNETEVTIKIYKTKQQSIKIVLPERKTYISTVVAFNNAMEPSKPVCSDGITLDKTNPTFKNVILEHAKATERIGCLNGDAYYILENLTAIPLIMTDYCKLLCNKSKDMDIISVLPKGLLSNDSDIASGICKKVKVYNDHWAIYLPSDKIFLQWTVTDAESQIRDVEIGITSDSSRDVNPDIMSYKRMHSHRKYSKSHTGLERGRALFILLKATNKADLETIIKLGPIVIDETPPVYDGSIDILISNGFVYCLWSNNTFREMEQKEPLSSFLFRISRSEMYVTPYLQASIEHTCPGLDHRSHCFKYRSYRLQSEDTEEGHMYRITMHVYNIAGHFVSVKSPDFLLPAIYPPGQGIVKDVTETDIITDIDYMLQNSLICAVWNGFWHHRNVSFDIGIGDKENKDNVAPFRTCMSGNHACIKSPLLNSFQKYYFVVRASCSGGSTISSSDGFVVIDQYTIMHNTSVSHGRKCLDNDILPTSNLDDVYISEKALLQENVYTVACSCSQTSIDSKDVIWIQQGRFIPSSSHPQFRISKTNNGSTNTTCFLSISSCNENSKYSSSLRQLLFYWEIDRDIFNLITAVKVAVHDVQNNSTLECMDMPRQKNIMLSSLDLTEGHQYRIALKPCFDEHSIGPVMSEIFQVETESPSHGMIDIETYSRGNTTDVHLKFDHFVCSYSGRAIGYDMAVFDSENKKRQLSDWYTITLYNNSNVEEVISTPLLHYQHYEPTVCIRAVCKSGTMDTVCQKASSQTHPNYFNKYIVYEMDADSVISLEIEKLVSVSYIGYKLRDIHRNELNFVKLNTKIVGVILNAHARNFNWYIMKTPNVPSITCNDDPDCVQMVNSTGGIGHFLQYTLEPEIKYYVCAFSNRTVQIGERYSQIFEEIKSCGNGFSLDINPPIAGSVEIETNLFGFLTDPNFIAVKWEDFQDSESGIAGYDLSIGTSPGGQDVVSSFSIGRRTSVILRDVILTNGFQYFASVKGYDSVGHVAFGTSEGVVLDITPPSPGVVLVGSGTSRVISPIDFTVMWTEFADNESGIKNFRVSIAANPDGTDPCITHYNLLGQYLLIEDAELRDGHTYFATVTATNHAGLEKKSVSYYFIFDGSPPEGGSVRDGLANLQGDIDYQSDIVTLSGHWDGFHDPHSDMKYYEVAIGTIPGEFDVIQLHNVGLNTEFTHHSLFSPGVKYYFTVRACNGAGLCTSRTSDGVTLDNSPPIPGVVYVGHNDRHQHYIGHRNFITARWVGFQDPHSNIARFEWCIGNSINTCDIHGYENCLLANSITFSGVSLQENTDYYITVSATNHAGLTTQRSSDTFTVDTSPPYVVQKPSFITKGIGISYSNMTQWDHSLLQLEWSFADDESYIADQTVLIRSHKNGHTVMETIVVANQKHLQLDKETLLKDGDTYTAWVTVCNYAGLCSSDATNDHLIDSSPPHQGGFHKGMKWKTLLFNNNLVTEVELLWHGFVDVESDINTYHLQISMTYSGAELSNGTIVVKRTGETIQNTSVVLTKFIGHAEKIILSIWATNGVGLTSSIGKVTVTLVATDKDFTKGFLDIERHSCESHYCNNDCTCAVIGRKCLSSDIFRNCTELINIVNGTELQVYFGQPGFPQKITTSSKCLSIYWIPETSAESDILRYEWSMGFSDENYGVGIFDTISENVWYDIEKQTKVAYCLPSSRKLVHKESYVAYVRAWYSANTYITYSSEPITVDLTEPHIRKGSSIIESIDGCVSDIDNMNSRHAIQICWSRVFEEREGHLINYKIFGGTSQEADDLFQPVLLENTTYIYSINGSLLNPGTPYFFTVIATNNVGLTSSKVSDGILIDLDEPTSGVIFNTHQHKNVRYQSSTSTISASWHGFDDHQSYIEFYTVSLIQQDNGAVITRQESTGLSNTIHFTGLNLQHNVSYYFSMYATDAVGHQSHISKSEVVTIDTDGPIGLHCLQYSFIPLQPSSVSSTIKPGYRNVTLFSYSYYFHKNEMYKFQFNAKASNKYDTASVQIGSSYSAYLVFTENANGSYISENLFRSTFPQQANITVLSTFYELQTLLYECTNMQISDDYALLIQQISPYSFYISATVIDPESGVKHLEIGAGTTPKGFQIRPFTQVSHKNGFLFYAHVPHGSEIYPKAICTNNAGLTTMFDSKIPIIVDHTGPIIRNLSQNLRIYVVDSSKDDNTITNNETTETNTTMSVMEEVNINQSDQNVLHIAEVTLEWRVVDLESHIDICYCGIGFGKGSVDITNWVHSAHNKNCSLQNLTISDGEVIYPTVKCTNNIQLITYIHGDPMVISYELPTSSAGRIAFVTNNHISTVHETPVRAVQSNTTHGLMYWEGFSDRSDFLQYETRSSRHDSLARQWSSTNGRTFWSFELGGKEQVDVEVRAINIGQKRSLPINNTLYICPTPPILTGTPAYLTNKGDNQYMLSWNGVFAADDNGPLLYIVTAGSRDGYADIQRPISTTGESVNLNTESDDISKVYAVIRVISVTGLQEVYRKSFIV